MDIFLISLYILLCFHISYGASNCFNTRNIQCFCDTSSASCNGTQEFLTDIHHVVSNISDITSANDLISFTLKIENLELPEDFSFGGLKLTHLTIGVGLRNISNSIFNGSEDSLESLNLNSNIIEFFGQPFSLLHNLKELNLDYNGLNAIDASIFVNLSKLQYLSVSGNFLSELEENLLVDLQEIKTFVITGNNISTLSDIRITSSTLTKLVAENCSINGSVTEEALSGMPNLQLVTFSSNRLTGVESHALCSSHKLEFLNLSHNRLEYLENHAFSCLYNLISLDLHDNRLSLMKERAFQNLTKLKDLDLSGNLLEAILREYTTDLHSLEKLNLEHNKIKIVTSGTFSVSMNLQELLFNGNLLECSCELSYFASFLLNNSHLRINESILCDSPPATRGVQLTNVDFLSMACEIEDPDSEILETDEDDDYVNIHSALTTISSLPTAHSTEERNLTESNGLLYSTTPSFTPLITEADLNTTVVIGPVETNNTTQGTTETVAHTTKETISPFTTISTLASTNPTSSTNTTDIAPTTASTTSNGEITTEIPRTTIGKFTPVSNSTPMTTTEYKTSTLLTTYKPNATLAEIDFTTATELKTTTVNTITKVVDLSINITEYFVKNDDLCLRWSMHATFYMKPTCNVQMNSKKGKKFKNLKCPTDDNEVQQCLKHDSELYEFCINIYVSNMRKGKTCAKFQSSTTLTIASSSWKNINTQKQTTSPIATTNSLLRNSSDFYSKSTQITPSYTDVFKSYLVDFNVTYDLALDVIYANWIVAFTEPKSVCNLKLILHTRSRNATKGAFNCINNTYTVVDVKRSGISEICLVSSRKTYGTEKLCKHVPILSSEVTSSGMKDSGYRNHSLIVLLCLLLVVIVIIIVIVFKSVLKKRVESDRYNVQIEEQNALVRMSSYQQDTAVRYSFIAKEI